MDKGIFEGARFGDKFITNFGREAILISKNKNGYILAVANYPKEISNKLCSQCYIYDEFGRRNGSDYLNEYKIVSKYQEEINEEKLDELANEFADRESIPFSRRSDMDSFKAGYRKAKEE